jgi:hypothetical protein
MMKNEVFCQVNTIKHELKIAKKMQNKKVNYSLWEIIRNEIKKKVWCLDDEEGRMQREKSD